MNALSPSLQRVLKLSLEGWVALSLEDGTARGATPRALQWLEYGARATESAVELRVSNGGPKIPAEIQDKMLTPFFSTTQGAGLGLNISRRILREHGGHLSLDTQAVHTCFAITMPRRTEPSTPPGTDPSPSQSPAPGP